MTMHRYHSYNFRFQLPRQRIVSVHNNAACCNSHVQENMLSSNRFTSIQAKPHFGFQNLGCHCKFLGCHFDTQKRLKKHWSCELIFSDVSNGNAPQSQLECNTKPCRDYVMKDSKSNVAVRVKILPRPICENVSSRKPNILHLFNLGRCYLWWLQHSVAAVLLFEAATQQSMI